MIAIIVAMVLSGGRTIISTIYLYWQWFHYTRQSYGISRIYGRKGPPSTKLDEILDQIIIYGVPLWGILYRSHYHNTHPNELFLGSKFWAIPVPDWLLWVSGLVAFGGLALWLGRLVIHYLAGTMALTRTAYMISHILIFLTGYWWLGDIQITLGWLVINVWHNAQYILIVWLYNNNRFKNGISPDHKFISFISQKKFLWLYFAVCLAITGLFYACVDFLAQDVASRYLPNLISEQGGWMVVAYQGINFHHYIVDGYIWKVRKKETRERLGVEGSQESQDPVDQEIANVVE